VINTTTWSPSKERKLIRSIKRSIATTAVAVAIAIPLLAHEAGAVTAPINTVINESTPDCQFQVAFGNIYGAAYSKVRVTYTKPGYRCDAYSIVYYARNGAIGSYNSGQTTTNSNWAQSTVPYANVVGATFALNDTALNPRTGPAYARVVQLSAF
jgi:hypothetical protein